MEKAIWTQWGHLVESWEDQATAASFVDPCELCISFTLGFLDGKVMMTMMMTSILLFVKCSFFPCHSQLFEAGICKVILNLILRNVSKFRMILIDYNLASVFIIWLTLFDFERSCPKIEFEWIIEMLKVKKESCIG